jgi:hypothetical protein
MILTANSINRLVVVMEMECVSCEVRTARIILNKSALRGQSEWQVARLEAGSNAPTVALRVVGGNEKGTQCLEL